MSDQETPQRRIINVEDAEYMEWGKGDDYQAQLGRLSFAVGARKLGFNVTRLAPGKAAFPYHLHHNNEELFIVIEGSGKVRLPDGEHATPARRPGVLPAGRGRARTRSSTTPTRTSSTWPSARTNRPRSSSTQTATSAPRWSAGLPATWPFRKIFRQDADVDYWDGEA